APTAVRAGGDHAEHSAEALLGDASLSAALGTDDGRASGFCSSPVAFFALVLFFEFDGSLSADGDFFQGEFDLGFQIEAAMLAMGARACRPPAAKSAAERPAEDVVEHREDVPDIHVRKIVRPLYALVAQLIVAGALVLVRQHLVGLSAFLEMHLCLHLAFAVV